PHGPVLRFAAATIPVPAGGGNLAPLQIPRLAAGRVSESRGSPPAPRRQAQTGRDQGGGESGSRDHRGKASIALSQDQCQQEPVSHAAAGAAGREHLEAAYEDALADGFHDTLGLPALNAACKCVAT